MSAARASSPQPRAAGDLKAVRGRRPAARSPDRAIQDVWVERLRAGDAEALREVVHAFGERLTAVVSGVLRDRDAVEDVVQETFTKAFYRIHGFKGGSSLYTWLYRVAVNAAKDYIKSRKRRPASSFDDLPGRASMPAQERPMVEGLERREMRLKVRASIDQLPHRFRTVLALREIEGMAYNEIAEVLGLSLGTVESRLFRARHRLRALLTAERAKEEGGAS
ncbi:MAG: sigma-70 family RNA polymerase sigma factor [Planctomycetota bacterium]|nr:sigma-70 family RNA polymerase sigma factor [Planctomycetota bacterium]